MITLFMVGCLTQSFAQDELLRAKIKKEEVPVTIIEAVEDVFPDYQMDEFYAIPIDFIEEDIIIDELANTDKSYGMYEVTLKNKHKLLKATYNKKGVLLNSIEKDKDIVLPAEIRNVIAKEYPGWALTKDIYTMKHSIGKKDRLRYKIYLEKGRNKIKIYTDTEGKIL